MRKTRRWFIIPIALVLLASHAAAVAPFKKVSIASSTTSSSTTTTTTTSTEAPISEAESETKNENGTHSGPTKNPKLTGIPQIDYIWDPNLPRELRGYNLSSYPFFATVPPEEDIHFKCDGLHDGFYASIEHKCQVYHHCVYGIRHDFLCANFTAFDQKTFICHFVSDVDCEGSQKYWNRNDDLYMATTTTSTTTTTTEPPPTPRRRPGRPGQGPLRRPYNRRPIDDYYYDEDSYDEDYYEDRFKQRRKPQQRPRHRKPQLDYDDDYEEKRSFSDMDKPRRHNPRDRFRDPDAEVDEDYEMDRRKQDRPKGRNKANAPAERRKAVTRRPGILLNRPNADERRSFSDPDQTRPVIGRKDKPRPLADETSDFVETSHRRGIAGNRRRINEKRPVSTASTIVEPDESDYYEKEHTHDQEEAAEEEAPPKFKPTTKPLEEFVTPKAASASVYARPRAPPRIARPVPVNEKKKYEYPVQKTVATTANPAAGAHSDVAAEDYEEYDDYEETPVRTRTPAGRRRIVDDAGAGKFETDEYPVARRRTHNDGQFIGRKPGRTTIRKPYVDKKTHLIDDEDYDSASGASNGRSTASGIAGRKRPYNGRTRTSGRVSSPAVEDDVDFVDEEYEDVRPAHRLRPKTLARKGPIKPRPAIEEDEELYEADPEPPAPEPAKPRPIASNAARSKGAALNSKLRHHVGIEEEEAGHSKLEAETDDGVSSSSGSSSSSSAAVTPNKLSTALAAGRHTAVRVVKRPFLPSRGGSPYLPRGLQPVGVALRPLGGLGAQTTDSTPIDMGSTISGVRLLEHGAPILRDSGNERDIDSEPISGTGHNSLRTTLPPRNVIPVVVTQNRQEPPPPPQLNKATLDELYENDYDVTLNDALNPTLKPLSPHPIHHHSTNRNYASAYASSASGAANPFVNNNQSPAIKHQHHNHNNNNNNNSNKNNHNNNNNNNPNSDNENNYHQQQSQQQITYHSLSPHYQSQSQMLPQTQSHHPLEQSQQLHNQQQHPQQPQQQNINNYNSDSYFSSTDIRRRAIIVPAPPASSHRQTGTQYRGVGTRIAQHFYDDFDY